MLPEITFFNYNSLKNMQDSRGKSPEIRSPPFKILKKGTCGQIEKATYVLRTQSKILCAQFEHVVILGSSLCDFGSTGKSARALRAQLKILRARVKLARAVRARASCARRGSGFY